MKTLKKLTLLSCLVLGLSLLTISCKKDTPAPLKTLDGKFVGHSNVPLDPTNYFLSFSFNADKTLTIYDENNLMAGVGTWTLNGDVLTGDLTFTGSPSQFSFTSIFDAKTGIIASGTWGFKPNTAGLATFTMTKQ